MKLHHRKPCAECPWRLAAPAGWLGGHTPVMYADAVAGNEITACHLRDHGPDDDATAMCVGALATGRNSCIDPWKTPGAKEAQAVVGRRDDCFKHPAHFYRHHSGEDYVPFIIRMLS